MPVPRLIGEPPGRIAPVAELINTLEFEEMAKRSLPAAVFAGIADSGPSGPDRDAFDRIAFRPRLMVNTTALDLTTNLFGREMFAPIIIAPVPQQNRLHAEGELAMARGAAAARAVMIAPADSTIPIGKIAAESKADIWIEVNAAGNPDAAREKTLGAGARPIFLSPGAWDWTAIDQFRKGLDAPLVLRGTFSAETAKAAADRGIAVAVSSRAMEVLPAMSEAVAGKVPLLAQGSFRRGAHVLMALALGANAVLIGRPAAWGLAAYGPDGVQRVIEVLQTELARDMAMCGRPNMASIDRSIVRVRQRRAV